MKKILNKCPRCGGKLEYSALMQYSNNFYIKRNGELAKKCRKEDIGTMECGYISCTCCDFVTNCEFECEDNKNIKIWQEGNKFYYDDAD